VLNVISLLGPSRCGKGAIIPIITAAKNIELPFNTPDLDWYVDAYNAGDISLKALCRLASAYMLCYSWYGHLGRHINLRANDYYSLQRMLPEVDLGSKHGRLDKDGEFVDFLDLNDDKAIWNVFQWDIPPAAFEMIDAEFPIHLNPIYCYRSPYYLFTSWISSNRVKRSLALSRMFKYNAMPKLKNIDLRAQFEDAVNDNEVTFIESLGTYKYHDHDFSGVRITREEETYLLDLLEETRSYGAHWQDQGMLVYFERIVSDPRGFVEYLKDRFEVTFHADKLEKGIILMDERPMKEVLETDFGKMRATLELLGCEENVVLKVLELQSNYIENF